ncbi:MAG: hypothetical protein ABSC92_15420 [Rhizomicrobium sp.]
MLHPRAVAAAILIAGFATMLFVNLPGHLEFDSIRQLLEGRRGVYSNWHPPIMSWLLGVADAVTPGAALFVVFDAVLAYGALLSVLWLTPRTSWIAAVAAAIVVALPQLFLFQAIVWKDMLFADACVAAFVCLAHAAVQWRRPRLRFALLVGAACLAALAVLTRQNGIVVLPCAVLALAAIAWGYEGWRKALFYGASFLAVSAALALVTNAALQLRATRALGAVEQIEDLQLYDMAGMLQRSPDLPLPILDRDAPAMAKLLRRIGPPFYTPVGHDQLTDHPGVAPLIVPSVSAVSRQWRALVLAHPADYLAVRMRDFGWIFLSTHPDACLTYEVGVSGDPADLRAAGLAAREDDRDDWLDDDYATPLIGTPVLSHPFFATAGLIALFVLLRRRRPADLAMAGLLASAMLYTLSYFFIAISCEYRYLFALDLSTIAALFYLAADWRTSPMRAD